MGGMRLGHHGTAGRQCRGRVAACDREGQREVRSPEHRHRTDGDVAQAQVRPRQGLALRQSRVDPRLKEAAVAHDARKHPQLPDGTGALAFETRSRQTALGHAALDHGVAEVEDRLGDRLQERGARLQSGVAVGVEGLVREGAGAVDHRRGGG